MDGWIDAVVYCHTCCRSKHNMFTVSLFKLRCPRLVLQSSDCPRDHAICSIASRIVNSTSYIPSTLHHRLTLLQSIHANTDLYIDLQMHTFPSEPCLQPSSARTLSLPSSTMTTALVLSAASTTYLSRVVALS